MSEYRPGDVVVLTKGENKLKGELSEVHFSSTPQGLCLDVAGTWARLDRFLEQGWCVVEHHPKTQPLPIAKGIYIDRDEDIWWIDKDGAPMHTRSPWTTADMHYGPFTRLRREGEEAREWQAILRVALQQVDDAADAGYQLGWNSEQLCEATHSNVRALRERFLPGGDN